MEIDLLGFPDPGDRIFIIRIEVSADVGVLEDIQPFFYLIERLRTVLAYILVIFQIAGLASQDNEHFVE